MYTWQPNQSHNGYLEVFINLGWVGILLLVAVLITGYMIAIRSFRHKLPTGGLVLAFFAAGLIYNCTESALNSLTEYITAMVVLASIVVPARFGLRSASALPVRLTLNAPAVERR